MIYIENNSTNPYYNLALEEYVLSRGAGICRNLGQDGNADILLLWQNDKTVVVGRYQNTAQEIDERFCRDNGINIVRRNTGGGAVYHDSGNLNFSIITDHKQGDDISFGRFLSMIIKTLKELGVDARLQGRNDLTVGGLKISGSAQTILKGRILHHGTLLCNTDLDTLSGALRNNRVENHQDQNDYGQSAGDRSSRGLNDPGMYKSKAITSIRSRVANIQDFNNTVSINMLKSSLLAEFGKPEPLERHKLTEADEAGIRLLRESKYDTWQWNYGISPNFNFRKEMRFPLGTIAVSLAVEEGLVRQCAINGDFLGCMDISDIEQALVGTKLMFADVAACLAQFDAGLYFGGLSIDEVAGCFFG